MLPLALLQLGASPSIPAYTRLQRHFSLTTEHPRRYRADAALARHRRGCLVLPRSASVVPRRAGEHNVAGRRGFFNLRGHFRAFPLAAPGFVTGSTNAKHSDMILVGADAL